MLTKSKLVLSTALILGTISAASAESWDPVPGDRNPNAAPAQVYMTVPSVYTGRAQVIRTAPAVRTRSNYFDRASQTFSGGGF